MGNATIGIGELVEWIELERQFCPFSIRGPRDRQNTRYGFIKRT
jgi:hypothetical protein